ncbi:MAG: hypothetical protein IJK95_07295 [Firmicutes bacterium]|nr:hypothetical protein [Bacillota bacterium]
MTKTLIKTIEDMEALIEEWGFLPFFECRIPGFSVEELADPAIWYTDGDFRVWDWKGPIIRDLGCGYGKFFEKKAVFISKEWFPDFANYRRDGYDYEGLIGDELAGYNDRRLYELVGANEPVLSKSLKILGNYRKGGAKGFDTIITRLQMQTFVLVNDFKYMTDRNGKEYGWGVAEYATPEWFFGDEFYKKTYSKSPEESYSIIYEHLRKLFPGAAEADIRKVLG